MLDRAIDFKLFSVSQHNIIKKPRKIVNHREEKKQAELIGIYSVNTNQNHSISSILMALLKYIFIDISNYILMSFSYAPIILLWRGCRDRRS
jgi:hypothetical protein